MLVPAGPAAPTPGGGEDRLLEEFRRDREKLETRLDRLSDQQERSSDQLRRLAQDHNAATEGWGSFLGKFLVGSGLSHLLG